MRQSSLRQVFENSESTKRQYDLRQRAISLGWHLDQVIIIDSDQGQSGKFSADREGFQRLVTEVSLGRAGIVMGLEVSRLARNSSDWHRLLEICALTDTLVLDDDGLYNPAHFNDRLLLGLKGTMSEAELHVMRARLRGGIINKARRGELEMRLPIGFVYDTDGQVRLDPDTSIQTSVRQLFSTFRRTGSAVATVKQFREQGLKFPRRISHGPNNGDVVWNELQHSRVLWILHHPRYAGAYCFGRTHIRLHPDGHQTFVKLAPEEWTALIRDAHEGYITWDQFEQNVQRLRDNALLVHEARRDQGHYFPFARAEAFEIRTQLRVRPIGLTSRPVEFERELNRIEHILIAKWFRQKLNRPRLHSLHGHRDVAVASHEDDRNLDVGLR